MSLSSEVRLDDFSSVHVCVCINCALHVCVPLLLVSQGHSREKNVTVEKNAVLISAAYL